MKLVTFSLNGRQRFGLVHEDAVLDLSLLAEAAGDSSADFHSLESLLRAGDYAFDRVHKLHQRHDLLHEIERHPLDAVRLHAPIPAPGKIVAIGLNYLDHCTEQGIEPPAAPLLFSKFPSSITGPFDPIVIPQEDPEVDYEVELAVVIGRRAKRVSEDQAMQHVAGYMVLNDVSARKWQFADKQWTRGKSCDTFAPTGPWLTTADEIPDPHALTLSTRVNGQELQNSSTKNLIFRVPNLISYISATITLEPGDIIATGTPPGVGVFRKPPIYLKPGDRVEATVERLGTLRNPVIAEGGAPSSQD